MALVKCYDPAGNEHIKEPIDARECVEHCGFTMSLPEKVEVKEEVKQAEQEDKPSKGKKG